MLAMTLLGAYHVIFNQISAHAFSDPYLDQDGGSKAKGSKSTSYLCPVRHTVNVTYVNRGTSSWALCTVSSGLLIDCV